MFHLVSSPSGLRVETGKPLSCNFFGTTVFLQVGTANYYPLTIAKPDPVLAAGALCWLGE
jgi:hypothetical protein